MLHRFSRLAVSAVLTLLGSLAVAAEPHLDAINATTMSPSLTVAGQPSREDINRLRKAGFTTVINLRPASETSDYDESAAVGAAGMLYVNIPVAGADGITRANAKLLAQALDSADGPVFLHCASGNRAGALLGLKAALTNHAEPTTALAYGRTAGMRSPALEQRLEQEISATASQ
ncbi:MAG: protein tyrosine phosphatase family protein [Gammaproteobacteria bacterium]|nr:protein tyrosine phosphatase family protein [Gammaproteobacteria bacterium]